MPLCFVWIVFVLSSITPNPYGVGYVPFTCASLNGRLGRIMVGFFMVDNLQQDRSRGKSGKVGICDGAQSPFLEAIIPILMPGPLGCRNGVIFVCTCSAQVQTSPHVSSENIPIGHLRKAFVFGGLSDHPDPNVWTPTIWYRFLRLLPRLLPRGKKCVFFGSRKRVVL